VTSTSLSLRENGWGLGQRAAKLAVLSLQPSPEGKGMENGQNYFSESEVQLTDEKSF